MSDFLVNAGLPRATGNLIRQYGHRGCAVLRDSLDMELAFMTNWGSPRRNGAQLLFADGSVRLIAYNTEAKIVNAVLTPNGHEPVPEF